MILTYQQFNILIDFRIKKVSIAVLMVLRSSQKRHNHDISFFLNRLLQLSIYRKFVRNSKYGRIFLCCDMLREALSSSQHQVFPDDWNNKSIFRIIEICNRIDFS
jgi:hypothetical protein